MRYRMVLVALTVFLMSALAERSEAGNNVDLGVSMEDGKLKGFYIGVRDYYKVPEKEVVVIRERRLPDDEMPVVFFIASKAEADPGEVIDLRLDGYSWMEITDYYDLSPGIYYVRFKHREGPYGRAWGHYDDWRRRRHGADLTDEDIINLVNLRFLCERYGLPPERVIFLRSSGKTFVTIDYELRSAREARERDHERRRPEYRVPDDERGGRHDNGRHKGWGRGRGHDREDD